MQSQSKVSCAEARIHLSHRLPIGHNVSRRANDSPYFLNSGIKFVTQTFSPQTFQKARRDLAPSDLKSRSVGNTEGSLVGFVYLNGLSLEKGGHLTKAWV